MKRTMLLLVILTIFSLNKSSAQIDQSQMGAWYMYFWNTSLKDSQWGFQGDIQHRNWNIGGDLEQLLLRGGITYSPKNAGIKFTLGYGNIQTGAFGDSKAKTGESRIYQEALFPQKIGRVFLNHRFRFEQRFVDNQDFRTRYRYNIFLNIPLNNDVIEESTVYLALYNELFVNGQKSIGNVNSVQLYDRNRTYMAFGYALQNDLKVQFGVMRQTTNAWAKNQLQLSLHHKF